MSVPCFEILIVVSLIAGPAAIDEWGYLFDPVRVIDCEFKQVQGDVSAPVRSSELVRSEASSEGSEAGVCRPGDFLASLGLPRNGDGR